MAETKKASELLAEVYRNTHYALQSIADVLPDTEDEKLREELIKMHDGYEQISGKAAIYARDNGIELKEPGAVKKAMMWGSIKMNTLKDDSSEHIAEMMTQGTVMGITALSRSLGESREESDEQIIQIAEELLQIEQKYEETLKTYL